MSVSVLPNKRQYQNSISRNKCKDDNDFFSNAVFVIGGVGVCVGGGGGGG